MKHLTIWKMKGYLTLLMRWIYTAFILFTCHEYVSKISEFQESWNIHLLLLKAARVLISYFYEGIGCHNIMKVFQDGDIDMPAQSGEDIGIK